MKYTIITFGCRVNQADSLAIEAELYARGGEAVSVDRADLVIVNTCSVTASADQGARQTIRRIARENPAAGIVATGCYATRCGDEVAGLPGVVAVIPNTAKTPGLFFAELYRKHEPVGSAEGPCGRLIAPGLMGRTAWTLRVQTGCEESCSYCIIPATRGPSRSRTIDDIHAEVARVVAAGYKEIAITGVHLGSYGRDLRPRSSLSQLLGSLSRIGSAEDGQAICRSHNRPEHADRLLLFRVSSLEPMDCTSEVVDLIAGTVVGPRAGRDAGRDVGRDFNPAGVEKGPAGATDRRAILFAPHFHLPLQHASDRVLRLMKRPYSIDYYATLVDTVRERLPHASIGSDVIAGFPGETDRDFEELTTYLERSPLTHLHVFPYSERPGTVASTLSDQVHGSVIKTRAQRLREISRELQVEFRARQRGSVRPALTIEDGSVAVTDNYFRVPAPPGHPRNHWVTVTL